MGSCRSLISDLNPMWCDLEIIKNLKKDVERDVFFVRYNNTFNSLLHKPLRIITNPLTPLHNPSINKAPVLSKPHHHITKGYHQVIVCSADDDLRKKISDTCSDYSDY